MILRNLQVTDSLMESRFQCNDITPRKPIRKVLYDFNILLILGNCKNKKLFTIKFQIFKYFIIYF